MWRLQKNMYAPSPLGEGVELFTDVRLQNVTALMSVGGWTGSRFFSSNVGSAENRTNFVKVLTDLVAQYDLDGLDFEYAALPSPPLTAK